MEAHSIEKQRLLQESLTRTDAVVSALTEKSELQDENTRLKEEREEMTHR
jgi:hypothetical protein